MSSHGVMILTKCMIWENIHECYKYHRTAHKSNNHSSEPTVKQFVLSFVLLLGLRYLNSTSLCVNHLQEHIYISL